MNWHIDPSKLVITDKLVHRIYRVDDCLISEFSLNGLYHNPNNIPALVEIYDCGTWRQCYYINGDLHRDDGPAFIKYNIVLNEVQKLFCTKDRIITCHS